MAEARGALVGIGPKDELCCTLLASTPVTPVKPYTAATLNGTNNWHNHSLRCCGFRPWFPHFWFRPTIFISVHPYKKNLQTMKFRKQLNDGLNIPVLPSLVHCLNPPPKVHHTGNWPERGQDVSVESALLFAMYNSACLLLHLNNGCQISGLLSSSCPGHMAGLLFAAVGDWVRWGTGCAGLCGGADGCVVL